MTCEGVGGPGDRDHQQERGRRFRKERIKKDVEIMSRGEAQGQVNKELHLCSEAMPSFTALLHRVRHCSGWFRCINSIYPHLLSDVSHWEPKMCLCGMEMALG